jgi:hypothetical protein
VSTLASETGNENNRGSFSGIGGGSVGGGSVGGSSKDGGKVGLLCRALTSDVPNCSPSMLRVVMREVG